MQVVAMLRRPGGGAVLITLLLSVVLSGVCAVATQEMISVAIDPASGAGTRPYRSQAAMQCSCQDYACACHKECFCRIIDKSIASLKAEAANAAANDAGTAPAGSSFAETASTVRGPKAYPEGYPSPRTIEKARFAQTHSMPRKQAVFKCGCDFSGVDVSLGTNQGLDCDCSAAKCTCEKKCQCTTGSGDAAVTTTAPSLFEAAAAAASHAPPPPLTGVEAAQRFRAVEREHTESSRQAQERAAMSARHMREAAELEQKHLADAERAERDARERAEEEAIMERERAEAKLAAKQRDEAAAARAEEIAAAARAEVDASHAARHQIDRTEHTEPAIHVSDPVITSPHPATLTRFKQSDEHTAADADSEAESHDSAAPPAAAPAATPATHATAPAPNSKAAIVAAAPASARFMLHSDRLHDDSEVDSEAADGLDGELSTSDELPAPAMAPPHVDSPSTAFTAPHDEAITHASTTAAPLTNTAAVAADEDSDAFDDSDDGLGELSTDSLLQVGASGRPRRR